MQSTRYDHPMAGRREMSIKRSSQALDSMQIAVNKVMGDHTPHEQYIVKGCGIGNFGCHIAP